MFVLVDAVEKGAAASKMSGKKKSPLQPAFSVDGDLHNVGLPFGGLPIGDVSYWSWARGSMYDAASCRYRSQPTRLATLL